MRLDRDIRQPIRSTSTRNRIHFLLNARRDVRIKNLSRFLPVSAEILIHERIEDFTGKIVFPLFYEIVYPFPALFQTEHVDLADCRHDSAAVSGVDGPVDCGDLESGERCQ